MRFTKHRSTLSNISLPDWRAITGVPITYNGVERIYDPIVDARWVNSLEMIFQLPRAIRKLFDFVWLTIQIDVDADRSPNHHLTFVVP